MATGMVLSVAQTLFAALQCKELRDLCSIFGYASQLDELQQTVTTLNAVLLNAESKQQELAPEGRVWVESLKDAVYDIDDLLDEFRTMALQQQQMPHAKVFKKVRRFFSRYNQFLVAFNASHEIKKIKEKLDSIAKNRSNFGFGDTYEPVKRRVDTCSYVREESLIGREKDREDIVGMLLRENDEPLSFVTIVGIGGLGKTALAQLVFNDNRIEDAFNLMMWVCVSEDFSMEGILSKMVERNGLTMEGLQKKVRQKIEGKKYLLVLDDVWNENRDDWVTITDFLKIGAKGSRVLVTSRSKQVAKVIGNNSMHWIQGLSDQNAWNLFKRMAFEDGQEPEDSKVVETGKEIVKKCANVPLSIRVIGSLLYGQEKSKWISFKSVELSKMGEDKEKILSILKFSYYHLTPSLKSCFSYCALFPKDYVIKKQFLITLWMAQGCLDDELQDDRSIEDVGEEYFSILLQRCFLQDIKKNEYSEIYSCKMHDLIHDLAQEVAGQEFSVGNTIPNNKKIRHISIDERSLIFLAQNDSSDKLKNLRTILISPDYLCAVDKLVLTKILSHVRRSRVFDLCDYGMRVIPKTLSNLVHLRYLRISGANVRKIPNSITKLLNLRVMYLSCGNLEKLPKDLGKLVNLRQLDMKGCNSLTHMPRGLDNLTCLHTLTMFVLGSGSSNQVKMGQLQELKHLDQLRGELKIVVRKGYSYDATDAEGGYLVSKSHIKALTIESRSWPEKVTDEGLLEVLEPHCDVRSIEIKGYKDMKLPNWAATLGYSLRSLVKLSLERFPRLQHLPLLSQLQYLKFLELRRMNSVEYMVDDNNNVPFTQVSGIAKLTFFQSLETLVMRDLPKMKGWWRDDILWSMDRDAIPSFPCLHELVIVDCPNMTSFPRCSPSHLKRLVLQGVDELKFCKKREKASGSQQTCIGESSSSSSIPVVSSDVGLGSIGIDNNNHSSGYDLGELSIDNIEMLNSLMGESLSVSTLHLEGSQIEMLSDTRIKNLQSDLQRLEIRYCENLGLEEEGEGMMVMMPWKALHTLIRLQLWDLPKMVNLPKGFQYLTSLQSLEIVACDNLEALPEWVDSLTSLQHLRIEGCRKLKALPEAIIRLLSLKDLVILSCGYSLVKRCRKPDGEDWPKIRHIPSKFIG